MSHSKGSFDNKRGLAVDVRDGNIEGAIRILGRKVKRDGILNEVMKKQFYEQPSTKRRREAGEAVARAIKNNKRVKE